MRLWNVGLCSLLLLVACSDPQLCVGSACSGNTPRTDAGADAGADAGLDSGLYADAGDLDAEPNDLAFLDGSSDGGGQADATPLPDTGIGTASVDFPPQRALTDSAKTTIVGRTEASSGVTNVNVAGRAATSSDGFRTFRAEVDLNPGTNRISIQTTGTGPSGSFVVPDAVTLEIVRDDVILLSPRDLALDQANQRILITDGSLGQVVAVNLATKARRLISGPGQGTGRAFVEPWGIALDSTNNRALVMDRSSEVLFAVDLSNGNRTAISDENSSGVALGTPIGVVLDSARNRALIVDAGLDAVVAIALDTGARTIVSDATLGAGPPMSNPRDLALDATNQRAYVADSTGAALFIVDLSTGDRTVSAGSGPFLLEPWGVELDLANNRAYVGDSAQRSVFAVDLTTGARTVVADLVTGTGTLVDPRTLNRADDGTLYVIDSIQDAILVLDPSTGDRAPLATSENGSGAHFGGPWGVACHPSDPSAAVLVSDVFLESILAIDPRQGDRVLLSGPGGRGPVLDQPYAITYDVAGRRGLVTDPVIDALVAVDLATGDRSLIANEVTGTGPILNGPRGLVVGPSGAALVTDSGSNAVFSIDLSTGDRTTLSDGATGSGPAFDEPWGIALAGGSAYVVDSALGEVFRLDLSTGDRTLLPSGTPILNDPRSIASDGVDLYVADYAGGAIVRINATTGARTVVTDATTGRGPRFVALTGIAAHASGYLVAVDERDVLYAIEKVSGDRVYLSK